MQERGGGRLQLKSIAAANGGHSGKRLAEPECQKPASAGGSKAASNVQRLGYSLNGRVKRPLGRVVSSRFGVGKGSTNS